MSIENRQLVRFVMTTREALEKSNKIVQQVEMYKDTDSGNIYVVPIEEAAIDIVQKNEVENNDEIKIDEMTAQEIFNNYIKAANNLQIEKNML